MLCTWREFVLRIELVAGMNKAHPLSKQCAVSADELPEQMLTYSYIGCNIQGMVRSSADTGLLHFCALER